MNLVTTVTANATVDKTYRLDRFEPGTLMRVHEMESVPGGKGINVARVLRRLGHPALATGFVAGFSGAWIRHRLDQEGIWHDFVEVDGESRLSVTIPNPDGRGQTEILEPGPAINPDDQLALISVVERWARQSRCVVLAGSLPPGAFPDLYARIIRTVQAAGTPVALDASGEALRLGIAAHPFLVKPNRRELAALGLPPGLPGSVPGAAGRQALRALAEAWARLAQAEWFIVTAGEEGALAVCRRVDRGGGQGAGQDLPSFEFFWATPPEVTPVNPVGSGDAFLGGLLAGMLEGRDAPGCLRLASAAAAANVMVMGAGMIDRKIVQRLEEHVTVEAI